MSDVKSNKFCLGACIYKDFKGTHHSVQGSRLHHVKMLHAAFKMVNGMLWILLRDVHYVTRLIVVETENFVNAWYQLHDYADYVQAYQMQNRTPNLNIDTHFWSLNFIEKMHKFLGEFVYRSATIFLESKLTLAWIELQHSSCNQLCPINHKIPDGKVAHFMNAKGSPLKC